MAPSTSTSAVSTPTQSSVIGGTPPLQGGSSPMSIPNQSSVIGGTQPLSGGGGGHSVSSPITSTTLGGTPPLQGEGTGQSTATSSTALGGTPQLTIGEIISGQSTATSSTALGGTPQLQSSGQAILEQSGISGLKDIGAQLNYPLDTTVMNFKAPEHAYSLNDFNNDLISGLQNIEDQSTFLSGGRSLLTKGQQSALSTIAADLENQALKKSNPQEAAIYSQGKRIEDLRNNLNPNNPSQVQGLNREIELYNALIDKTSADYAKLPFIEQVGRRVAENIIRLPSSVASQLTHPLSSTVQFLESAPKTLLDAASGNPQAIADAGTILALALVGKGFEKGGVETKAGIREAARSIEPESVSTYVTPNELARITRQVAENNGITVSQARAVVSDGTISVIKLKDGRSFVTFVNRKLGTENALPNAVKGAVQIYGFEKAGEGKIIGRGVEQATSEGYKAYTKNFVFDSKTDLGRAVEILEQGKQIGSRGTQLRGLSATESLAKIYAEKELSRQESTLIRNLQAKFDKGLSVGLNELKNTINIDRRLNGLEPFTDKEFKAATQGITTTTSTATLLERLRVSQQLKNILGRGELEIRNGQIRINGNIERANLEKGITSRQTVEQRSQSFGRSVSRVEPSEVVKAVRKREGGLSVKQLEKNINKVNAENARPVTTKLKAPDSILGLKAKIQAHPLTGTIVRALTKAPEKVVKPRVKEFPIYLGSKSVAPISLYAGKGTYERTSETVSRLPSKIGRVVEPTLNAPSVKVNIASGRASNLGIKPNLNVKVTSEFKNLTETGRKNIEAVRPKIEQTQKTQQVQGFNLQQVQQNKLDLKTQQKTELRTNLRIRNPEPTITKIPKTSEEQFSKHKPRKEFSKRISTGFAPLVKEKGKFVRISNISYKTPEEALGAGEEKAFTDLTRSVTLIKTRGERTISSTRERAAFNLLTPKFRPSKQYGAKVLVQKNALSTKSEISQIQEARLKSGNKSFKKIESPFKRAGAKPIRSIF